MRLFCALGPGDIVADISERSSRRGETSITFSRLLVDSLKKNGHEGLLVSYNPREDRFDLPGLTVINAPRQWQAAGGLKYHFGMVFYAVKLACMAKSYRADLAIIDSGTTHYFLLTLFRVLGIKVAVNLHNVRWPSGCPPKSRVSRSILALDNWFFRYIAAGAMGCSPECERQLKSKGAERLPYQGWTAQFDAAGFNPAAPTRPERRPFEVVFVGRVERNKGVFDILSIAQQLRQQDARPVRFVVCGDGSALEEVRSEIIRQDLSDSISVVGRLERTQLLKAYGRADLVIVPTRSDFCEGMPLVCAEAVLSGRPILTSRLSNALDVLGDAILEVQPEDISGYASAIRQLADDSAYYGHFQSACARASRQFVDPAQSYGEAVQRLIMRIAGSQRDPERKGSAVSLSRAPFRLLGRAGAGPLTARSRLRKKVAGQWHRMRGGVAATPGDYVRAARLDDDSSRLSPNSSEQRSPFEDRFS